jgi:hypothetical protein
MTISNVVIKDEGQRLLNLIRKSHCLIFQVEYRDSMFLVY